MLIKTILAAVLSIPLAASVSAQVVVHGPVAKEASDISHLEAARRADSFLRTVGLATVDFAKSRAMLHRAVRGRSGKYWKLSDEVYNFSIDAVSGKILMFAHRQRHDEQYRGLKRTGLERFSTEAQARAHLRAIATAAGIPKSTTMDFTSKKDGQVRDANDKGYFGANFRDASGKIIGSVSCDPQDGMPMFITVNV